MLVASPGVDQLAIILHELASLTVPPHLLADPASTLVMTFHKAVLAGTDLQAGFDAFLDSLLCLNWPIFPSIS